MVPLSLLPRQMDSDCKQKAIPEDTQAGALGQQSGDAAAGSLDQNRDAPQKTPHSRTSSAHPADESVRMSGESYCLVLLGCGNDLGGLLLVAG